MEKLDGLGEHGVAQGGRVVGKTLGVGLRGGGEFIDAQPLAREIFREGAGFGIKQHALHLRLEHGGLAEGAGVGHAEKLVVRHARPEEIREAAGEFVIADRRSVQPARHLDAEKEIRRDQHPAQGVAHGVVEALAARVGLGEKFEQQLDLRGLDGPAEGAGDKARDVRPRRVGLCQHGAGAHGDEALGFRRGEQLRGDGEIFFHEHRRGEERRGVVVEAAAAAAVGRELVGGMRVEAEQVADGVVVFLFAQPVEHGLAGIARHRGEVGIVQRTVEPGDEALALIRAGLGLVVGRHGLIAQFRQHFVPHQRLAVECGEVAGLVQFHAGFGFLRAVAFEAIGFQDWAHVFRKVRRMRAGEREGEGEDEKAEAHAHG